MYKTSRGTYDAAAGWQSPDIFLRAHFAGDSAQHHRVRRQFIDECGFSLTRGDIDHIRGHAIRFDSFVAATLSASDVELRWNRDRALAQRRYMFLLVSKGTVDIDGAGPSHKDTTGGVIIVFPSSEPVFLRALHRAEFTILSFDSAEVMPFRLTPEGLRPTQATATVFRTSYAFLHALTQGDSPLDVNHGEMLRAQTRAVAKALIGAFAPTPAKARGIHERAMEIIHRDYELPQLNPDRLAARLGISRSTLGRAFAEHGVTAAGEIRRIRAEHAARLLAADAPPIKDVLLLTGFGSANSLYRALRARRAERGDLPQHSQE